MRVRVCVCVRACVCMSACVCVCVCVYECVCVSHPLLLQFSSLSDSRWAPGADSGDGS